MRMFEIYFNDLTEDARRRYLQFIEAKDPSELNADVFPICVIETEVEDGKEELGD